MGVLVFYLHVREILINNLKQINLLQKLNIKGIVISQNIVYFAFLPSPVKKCNIEQLPIKAMPYYELSRVNIQLGKFRRLVRPEAK
jgi:hypothetical protein